MLINTVVFTVVFHLAVTPFLVIKGFQISPHIQAFIVAFLISNPIGFLLSRYIVFTESNIRGRVQAFRYALLVATCTFLNYVFLKMFVEWMHLYAPLAQVITTAIVAVFSYVSQRNFTFKVKEAVVK